MRKILLILVGSLIVVSFLVGCATTQTQDTEMQNTEQYRSFTMAFAQNGESITKTFILPLEFPDLNGVESASSGQIYTQFYIMMWDVGDNRFGLIFDKSSPDLMGAAAAGTDYDDYDWGMKAWIYPNDVPVECTVDEQDMWFQEMDYELSQRNRMSI